jgi:hypothetical protein
VRDDLDQIVDPAERVALPPMLAALLDKYSYLEPRGRVLCWDHGRFVNHSCDPNCRSTGFDFEIAVRDIQLGDEITDDYGSLNVDYEFDCRCGSARCRGTIRASDITRFADECDRDAAAAFRLAGTILASGGARRSCRSGHPRAYSGSVPILSTSACWQVTQCRSSRRRLLERNGLDTDTCACRFHAPA